MNYSQWYLNKKWKTFIGIIFCVFTFLSPVNLTAITMVSYLPQHGIDAAGDQVAVWEVLNTLSGTSNIQASSKPFSGSWSLPVIISVAGEDSTAPLIAMNSSGNSVAIWRGETGSMINGLYAAMLPIGGSWSAPTLVSTLGDDVRPDYKVTMNDAGQILVLYSSYISLHVFAINAPFGGSWSAPMQVSN